MAREILTQRHGGTEHNACAKVPLQSVLADSFSGEWGEECAAGSGVCVLRTVNFTNEGVISFAKIAERAIKDRLVKAKKLCPGDIIVEKSGGTKDKPVGRVVYFDRSDGVFLTNNFTQVLRPDSQRVDSKYLLYVLLALYKMKITESLYNKTTGIQNLQMKGYLNLLIPLPPIPEQKRIAAILDKICEMKRNAEARLQKLDLLVKARFVEMFGDPLENPLGFTIVALKELTTKIGSGATPKGGKESYRAEGVSLIRSMNVHDGSFKYIDLAHLSDKQAQELNNVTVQSTDVLVNITGASVARSCIVPDDVLPARVNQHVAIIRPNDKVLPLYLNRLFIYPSFKRLLLGIGESGGATRQAITKQQLEMLRIPLPPLALQRQFAAFVEKVEGLKATAKKELEQVDLLYRAKLQEFFG